jgi:hypothetical protein
MYSLVVKIFQDAIEIGLPSEDLNGLEDVIDTCLSVLLDPSLQEDDINTLNYLLTLHSTYMSSDLVIGQYPVSLVTQTLRSTSLISSPFDLNSISVPKSSLEMISLNNSSNEFTILKNEQLAFKFKSSFSNLNTKEVDIVVDYCAYDKNDIEVAIQATKDAGLKVKKWIYISTDSVYEASEYTLGFEKGEKEAYKGIKKGITETLGYLGKVSEDELKRLKK